MSRVIVLSDGPHNVEPPSIRVLAALQKAGYKVDKTFSPETLTTGEGDDVVWDFTALADHIAACLGPEYDTDRVLELMVLSKCADYYDALRALAEEAFGGDPDPLASSGDSPT